MEELVVRGSEYQDFLTCKKRWYHSWYEKIEPKRPDNKLFFGTLFHKWLEFYYNNGCELYSTRSETLQWYLKQDTSGMEQTELDGMWDLFIGVSTNYDKKYGNTDRKFNVLATELEFLVYLGDGIYYTGTIDLVYEVDGKVRFADHKTIASISTYVEKSKMDRQISRYWWALERLSEGKGMIRDKFTNDEWIEWKEIQGREITGFDYNLITKDFPKEPEVLKKGNLSQNKSQRTSYDLYLAKIHSLGLNESDYTDFLEMLKNKPDLFLHREDVKRGQSELEAAIWEFFYTAQDIQELRKKLDDPAQTGLIEPLTYRNIGEHCMYMCSFRSLCETAIQGGNVSLTRSLAYKNKEEVKQ